MSGEEHHWSEAETFAERMKWARLNLTDAQGRAGRLPKATDGAAYVGVKAGTYRTYETPKGEGGREPPLEEIKRIAIRFRVNWIWLATGEGRPDVNVLADERLLQLGNKIARLDPSDQDAAIDAATSFVETLQSRRAKRQ